MEQPWTFVVEEFHDKWGVFSTRVGSPKQLEIAFDSYDRAIAGKELLEHWYAQ